MQPGTFDPALFLNAVINDVSDDKFEAIPAGEYTAVSGECKVSEWQSKDGSKSGLKITLPWKIDDASLKATLGRDPSVRQEIMLDITEQNTIATGKGMNIRLGQLRTALGLNKAGAPFSFNMLSGKPAKIKVKLRQHPDEPDRQLNDVAGVAPL